MCYWYYSIFGIDGNTVFNCLFSKSAKIKRGQQSCPLLQIFSKLVAHHLIILVLILSAQHLAAGFTNGALFG
jgi:hypothetical protein